MFRLTRIPRRPMLIATASQHGVDLTAAWSWQDTEGGGDFVTVCAARLASSPASFTLRWRRTPKARDLGVTGDAEIDGLFERPWLIASRWSPLPPPAQELVRVLAGFHPDVVGTWGTTVTVNSSEIHVRFNREVTAEVVDELADVLAPAVAGFGSAGPAKPSG